MFIHPGKLFKFVSNSDLETVHKMNIIILLVMIYNQITGTLQCAVKHKATKEFVIKLYKSMAVPTLTYGSETWTMSARRISRIQAKDCLLYTSRCV